MSISNELAPMKQANVGVEHVVNPVNENHVPNTSLDLEWYSSNYVGLTRAHRLEYVADNFPQMRVEALKLALEGLTNSYNFSMYQKLSSKLNEAIYDQGLGGLTDLRSLLQPTWIPDKIREFDLKSNDLLNDLRLCKSGNDKENVRICCNKLGDLYFEAGDLKAALNYYSQAWYYCSNDKDIFETYMDKVKVSLLLNNWTHVLNYVLKAERVSNFDEIVKSDKRLLVLLKCATGIAQLGLNRYEAAATTFLQIDIDIDDFKFANIISPNNVATYAGLCALATFNRPEVSKHFIKNSPFRQFLEIEPDIRGIINNFYNSKYSLCLGKLDELKEKLLADIYMAPHVEHIFKEVRLRGILQYFSVYSTADMVRMAEAFNTPYEIFREELIDLIAKDKLAARIDWVKKLLVANEPDYEAEMYEKALEACDRFEKTANLILMRALFKKHNVLIQ